jgi:hypothetical protein
MKTAISISDSVFYAAEETASYMGIPRSKLYTLALEEYIHKHNGEMITKKLNEVYDKINQDEFANDLDRDLDVGLESLRELTKDDTW